MSNKGRNQLSTKQKIFCELYAANGGNALQAARDAGYRQPHPTGYENMKKPAIVEYIKSLTKDDDEKRIANLQERQRFWTGVMRGEIATGKDSDGNEVFEMKDRLKASELMGRSQMDFVEKRQVEFDGSLQIESITRTIVDES